MNDLVTKVTTYPLLKDIVGRKVPSYDDLPTQESPDFSHGECQEWLERYFRHKNIRESLV